MAGDHPPTPSQEYSDSDGHNTQSDGPENDFNRNHNDQKQPPSITNGLKRHNKLKASSESSRQSATSSDDPETGSQSDPDPDPDPDPDSGSLKKDGNFLSKFFLDYIL